MAEPNRKLGLALGSGAARGLAHIGVLKVLEEEEIPVHSLAGSSIGALIAALFAAGLPARQMETVAREIDWRRLARLLDPVFPSSGLIDGARVARFMEELLPVRTFEELRLPLAVVTTDIESGEPVIIRNGDLLTALRAAIAFPGIFPPVRFGNRFLVDGGLVNPVPADLPRQLGADVVIGVCAIPTVRQPVIATILPAPVESSERRFSDRFTAGGIEKLMREIWGPNRRGTEELMESPRERRPPGIFRIFASSVAIMENVINDLRIERNAIDLLIRPQFDSLSLLEFHRAAEAIRAGEDATRPLIPRIRKLLSPV
ncbi:MAG: patatin-like phospholipase family protein [Desulfuromonadales bacterium]|nr:patatin-like phospholipase family protein [Desulfuromonadales bacterium]